MDAQGARDLAIRIASNPAVAARRAPVDAPSGSLPLYQWFGGRTTEATEPPAPAKRAPTRRRRVRPA